MKKSNFLNLDQGLHAQCMKIISIYPYFRNLLIQHRFCSNKWHVATDWCQSTLQIFHMIICLIERNVRSMKQSIKQWNTKFQAFSEKYTGRENVMLWYCKYLLYTCWFQSQNATFSCSPSLVCISTVFHNYHPVYK